MYSKEEREKHIWIIIILSAIIILLVSIFNTGGVNLAGSYVDPKEVIIATIKTLIISIPIFGFIIGSLIALFPYKGLEYKQKILRASILSIIVIDAFLLVIKSWQYLTN